MARVYANPRQLRPVAGAMHAYARPVTEPTFTTMPLVCCAAMWGTTAWMSRSADMTFVWNVSSIVASGRSRIAPAGGHERGPRTHAGGRTGAPDAGVVHQDVDPALAREDRAHGGLHARVAEDVQLELLDARHALELGELAGGGVDLAPAGRELLRAGACQRCACAGRSRTYSAAPMPPWLHPVMRTTRLSAMV
jgi:hypothetical protein